MLSIELARDSDEAPHGFDLGHIKIMDNDTVISSQDEAGNTCMMIYLTLVELADQTRRLLDSESAKSVEVVGIDSSFAFRLELDDDETLTVRRRNTTISAVSLYDFAKAVLAGGRRLLDRAPLESGDAVLTDVMGAMSELRGVLGKMARRK